MTIIKSDCAAFRPDPDAPLTGSPALQRMAANVNAHVDETIRQLCEAAKESGMPSGVVNELIARIRAIPQMTHYVASYGAALQVGTGQLVA